MLTMMVWKRRRGILVRGTPVSLLFPAFRQVTVNEGGEAVTKPGVASSTHTHTLIRPHIHTLYKSHHAWCTETWARHCTDRRKEGWGEGGRAGRGVGEGRGGPVWWVPVTSQVLSSSDLICPGLHRCSALVCSSLSWPTKFILVCSSML